MIAIVLLAVALMVFGGFAFLPALALVVLAGFIWMAILKAMGVMA